MFFPSASEDRHLYRCKCARPCNAEASRDAKQSPSEVNARAERTRVIRRPVFSPNRASGKLSREWRGLLRSGPSFRGCQKVKRIDAVRPVGAGRLGAMFALLQLIGSDALAVARSAAALRYRAHPTNWRIAALSRRVWVRSPGRKAGRELKRTRGATNSYAQSLPRVRKRPPVFLFRAEFRFQN